MENHNGAPDGTTLHRHATMVPIGEFLRAANEWTYQMVAL